MVPRQCEPPRPAPPSRLASNITKQSYRSHSSSFEADDEHSTSDDRDSMVVSGRPIAQYEGQDTRPTSRKELWGWYGYGFAAEVYVLCGIGSFIPITLEQLSRENGVLLSDRSKPCIPDPTETSPVTLFTRLVSNRGAHDTGQCIVYLFGLEINTASFALYSFSISVLLQALLVISISCAADHGRHRKKLLLLFAFIGSTATMMFIFVTSKIYVLGAILAIISNTCFGASFVLLNSFLPLLVRHHPETRHTRKGKSTSSDADLDRDYTAEASPDVGRSTTISQTLLQLREEEHDNDVSAQLQISTRISAKGIGISYCAGLVLQCISIFVVLSLHSSTFSLRLVLFLVGVWWFTFSLPVAYWLRPRPGPPLPLDSVTQKSQTWPGYIAYSWITLYRTLVRALRLRDISLFLLAWFLLSDAIATVSSTAVLFAKTHLQMLPPALALINVIVTMAGILGAFTWSLISRYLQLEPMKTVMACLVLFELIPLYGLLAYLPPIQRLGYLGLQQPWEMYPLGFVYGLVLGGLSSYCRSLFGELIPPGSEAAFYALYAITDKGSSVFGPAVVGAIIDKTGEVRAAFWFLAVLVGLPAPILYFVNVERGKEEGEVLAEFLDNSGTGLSNKSHGSDEEDLYRGEGERLLADDARSGS